MNVVETYGKVVQEWCDDSPERARWLLKTGWQAQDLKYTVLPDKRLTPANQYLAKMMMELMICALAHPEQSAIVSIFTPCEMLQEVDLYPYNVEGFSCFLTGSKAERSFLQCAEDAGLAETLCSYHRTFIGAAEAGLLPKPKCIVYTSLACDANLVTFKHLQHYYDVPAFAIDVPMQQNAANVEYVARQLKDLKTFLEKETGKLIDERKLEERALRSKATLEKNELCQSLRKDRFIPSDLVTPMYAGMTGNVMLGMEAQEKYVDMFLEDIQKAPSTHGKRIYWMHTIPFWSKACQQALAFKDDAVLVGDELMQVIDPALLEGDAYTQMATRMVYHALNGSVKRRIENGIKHAKQTNADGVVWFNHWGCKHTLGGSQLAKQKFEDAGMPLLLLDGDGCDTSHGGEGQTATRLEAFLEMLGGDGRA